MTIIMQESTQIKVILRQRYLVFDKVVTAGLLICGVVVFVLLIWMVPAMESRASSEMKAAYFVLTVPEWLKVLGVISLTGFIVLLLLSTIRKKVPALLSLNDQSIIITSSKSVLELRHDQIKEVNLNDLKSVDNMPKGILQVSIASTAKDRFDSRVTSFYLNDYEDGGRVIDYFIGIPNLKVSMHDFNSPILFDE